MKCHEKSSVRADWFSITLKPGWERQSWNLDSRSYRDVLKCSLQSLQWDKTKTSFCFKEKACSTLEEENTENRKGASLIECQAQYIKWTLYSLNSLFYLYLSSYKRMRVSKVYRGAFSMVKHCTRPRKGAKETPSTDPYGLWQDPCKPRVRLGSNITVLALMLSGRTLYLLLRSDSLLQGDDNIPESFGVKMPSIWKEEGNRLQSFF